MTQGSLKKLRVVLAVVFFTAISSLFLDFRNLIPPGYYDAFLYLQFIPSILSGIDEFTLAAAGFLFIIVFTLLAGRFYCSVICPLGTLQDIFSNLYRRFRKKKYYRPLKSYPWIRYLFLSASVLVLLSGSLAGIYLLDPYSNFGRILSGLIKPVILYLNNSASSLLESFDFYLLYPAEIKGLSAVTVIFSLFFLAVVFIMSVSKGRLFCNTVCPVGTVLGFLTRYSIFRISIIEEKCKSCMLCERVCKAGCIDRLNKTVDFERCIGCYNCLSACRSEGISFRLSRRGNKVHERKEKNVDYDKREFIQKVSVYFLGLTGISLAQNKILPKKESKVPVFKKYPVTPPGSQSIEHFNDYCTACHLCVSACPAHVLQPSFLEYGFTGMLQPRMDYKISYCNFDCVICGDICPTGAIQNIIPEKKKRVQLGKAKFVKENCIVETENTACGACSEHCPTKAVNMVPYKSIHIPEVKEEYCIGCGACEYACPTNPYKAIYVEGNPVHKTAKKPESEKLEEPAYQEDFPF